MEKLKDKINSAGETNFDELSKEPLDAAQMDESLLGIASDIKPTKEALFQQTSKNYYIDPESGDKSRLKPN